MTQQVATDPVALGPDLGIASWDIHGQKVNGLMNLIKFSIYTLFEAFQGVVIWLEFFEP